jgi:hypothetical protein
MFDALLPVVTEVVESEAIGFLVYFADEAVSEADPLRVVEDAFEDRVLDTLAVAYAGFSDSSEASLPVFIFG